MKKFFSIIALVLVAMLLFSACNEVLTPATDSETEAPETTDPANTEDTEPTETEPPEVVYEPILPNYKESVKILAIGNSFSVDAMQHLAVILKDAGVKEIVLGNLYIGGCTLEKHSANMTSGATDYTFYTNHGDGWSNVKNKSIDTGILYEDWDIITVQQGSPVSGKPESYSYLQGILNYVKAKATNKDVKILWHMTWAYQQDFTNANFANYNKNQMTMYNAICSTVISEVTTKNDIVDVIPSGTAIQNLRTSYLGDTLTRDGYHLSLDIGRYTAALMWYKVITAASTDGITAVPTDMNHLTVHMPAIKEAVENAFVNRFAITQSTCKVAPPDTTADGVEVKPTATLTALTESDKTYLTGRGLNPDNYKALDLEATLKAYYSSTATPVAALNKTASNSKNYIATRIFPKECLPVDTIIHITSGYEYRLEGWQSLTKVNSLARLNKSTVDMTVTQDLLDKYNYIAFNIGVGRTATSADVNLLRIYVPVN